MRLLHVITPGDHFSPRTGSAIPTVVHGLSSQHADAVRPVVAVARGTFPERYPSADVVEYEPAPPVRLPRRVPPGLVDAATGLLGLPRYVSRPRWAAVLRDQEAWPTSAIIGHNAPQLIPLVDASRHRPFLFLHNDVFRTYRRWEAGRTLRDAAGVICVSEFLAERTRHQLPSAVADRVRVVHNGVDLDLFRRAEPLRPAGVLRVLFVGRMIHDKGPDLLVEAVRRLDRDDIHLTLVGSHGFSATDPLSSYEKDLHRSATALGDRVTLRPFLPRAEVAALMATSDVLVVPSRCAESFALTAREGLAAGMAVIASNVGGVPEALGDQGFLVKPGDPDQIADPLCALADDTDLLVKLGASGRGYVEARGWAASSAQLANVVKELA